MKNINQFAILAVGLGLSASALADSYQPYVWLDSAVRARKLEEKPPMAVLDVAPEKRPQFVSFDVSGTRLQFFKELGTLLGDVAGLTKTYEQDKTPAPQQLFKIHPTAVEELSRFLPASGSTQCLAIREQALQTVKASAAAGNEIDNPKAFVQAEFARTRPEMVQFLGKFYKDAISPKQLKLNTVKDYIIVGGAQLITIENFPAAVLTPSFINTTNIIFKKLWYQEFTQTLTKNLQAISAARNQVASANCGGDKALAVEKLNALASEITQAQSTLAQLDASGRAQAIADQRAVEARGRKRETLDYPNLSDSEREFIAMYVGGVFWRIRGGGVWPRKVGDEAGEYYNKIPLRLVGDLSGRGYGKEVGEGIFNRASLGYSRYMDMGRMNDDKYWDLVGMTKRGYFQIGNQEKLENLGSWEYKVRFGRYSDAKGVLKDAGFENNYTRVAGAHMGICYYFAFESTFNKVSFGKDLVFIPNGGTDVGEFCTGAALYLGMTKSLLNGRQ